MQTLSQKIAAITSEIGSIKKEKKEGSSVSYAYRGIDDVMNKLNPLLAKYEISLQSKIVGHSLEYRTFKKWNNFQKKEEDRTCCTATVHLALIFSDGNESQTFEEVAMSEDYGDKAMTQAGSMAYKYAICRKFCILTADIIDPDANKNDDKGTLKTRKQFEEEEAVHNWVQAINNCTTEEELKKVFIEAKAMAVKYPAIVEAKDKKKATFEPVTA